MASRTPPSLDDLTNHARRVEAASTPAAALAAAEPLVAAVATSSTAASLLLAVLGRVPCDDALPLAKAVFTRWRDDDEVLSQVGHAFEALTDLDDLNAAPPDDPWFAEVVAELDARSGRAATATRRIPLDVALAAAARRLGRAGDATCAAAHARLLETCGDRASTHYNHGLFLKTRGRFAEGLAANRRALALDPDDGPTRWNLGICATGAGDGAAALEVWRAMGQVTELGRLGLPDGRYPPAKVRLAQRPLAERTAADDDPGAAENVWVERLSPCHGIIGSALYDEDIGVELGDTILFDGAPIGRMPDGTPLFPHLATLHRGGFRTYWFVGRQPEAGAVAKLTEHLPGAVLYVFSEQLVYLCRSCSMGRTKEGVSGHRHEPAAAVRRLIGKLCAAPGTPPHDLLSALDLAVARSPGVELWCPSLCRAAGDLERAAREDDLVEGEAEPG